MNYTSTEQSKKLLELGLSPESADMWYNIDIVDKFGIDGYNNIPSFENVSDVDVPCWSVGALLELIPKKILFDNNYAEFIIAYPSYSDRHSLGYNRGNIPWKYGDTLLNTCFDMVVWLLENNYIKND